MFSDDPFRRESLNAPVFSGFENPHRSDIVGGDTRETVCRGPGQRAGQSEEELLYHNKIYSVFMLPVYFFFDAVLPEKTRKDIIPSF